MSSCRMKRGDLIVLSSFLPIVVLGGFYVAQNPEARCSTTRRGRRRPDKFVRLTDGVTHYKIDGPRDGANRRARARLLRSVLHLGFDGRRARECRLPRPSLRRIRARVVRSPERRHTRPTSTTDSFASSWTLYISLIRSISAASRWADGSPARSPAGIPIASAR